MKQFLKIIFLSMSLTGCVHEIDQSIFTDRSLVDEESSCRQQHRFCRASCQREHPYNAPNRERCFDNCEYRLTFCITSSSLIVQREPSMVVESYAPVYVDPYPRGFVGPYTFWEGRGYYHHNDHNHYHGHNHGHRFR